jgi:hypothetical protein
VGACPVAVMLAIRQWAVELPKSVGVACSGPGDCPIPRITGVPLPRRASGPNRYAPDSRHLSCAFVSSV